MARSYPLDVVTPERRIFRGQVEFLMVRGSDGDLGILAGHIPLITGVRGCAALIRQGSDEWQLAISGGFLTVHADGVILLAEAAETKADIDLAEARAALEAVQNAMTGATGEALAKLKLQCQFQEARVTVASH